MSRACYTDDWLDDNWGLIRWRGAVKSALRGKRGQERLRELIAALDAMPVKELIDGDFEATDGCCALGALARSKGIDVSKLQVDDHATIGKTFDISPAMAREIMYINDDDHSWMHITPAQRWERVRKWAQQQLVEWEKTDGSPGSPAG